MYDKHTANILNSEILKASPLRSETKNTLTQHSVISPSQCNQRTQTNKRIQMRMKVKLSLFTDDTISYVEKPKDLAKTLINKYSKVEGHKISTLESVVFLYTNNKTPEKAILKNLSHPQ